MKKILSFILLIAIIAAPALYAPSVSANTVGKTPDRAPTGERICEIKFGGSSADYAPHAFGPACGTGMPGISVSSDGSELTLTTAEGQIGGVFYGGKVGSLTLGEDRAYTVEFEMKFTRGDAGFFFNIAAPAEGDTSAASYTDLYGFYGQTKTSGSCFTLSEAGNMIPGEMVSSASSMTAIPTAARVGDAYCRVRVEINGYIYAVYLNDALYDVTTVNPTVVGKAKNLGVTFYLRDGASEFSVKNVNIYKNSHPKLKSLRDDSSNSLIYTYGESYLGERLYDFNFALYYGAFTPRNIKKARGTKIDVAPDGKSVTVSNGSEGGETYWGSNIHGLKIKADTKYTIGGKIKTLGAESVGIGFNLNWPDVTNAATGTRFNFYGNFADAESERTVRFADGDRVREGFDYSDIAYENFTPAIGVDGYLDISIELDGYTASFYAANAFENGKMTLVATVPLSAEDYLDADDLALFIYINGENKSVTLKDFAVWKGLTTSHEYVEDPKAVEDERASEKKKLIVIGGCYIIAAAAAVVVNKWDKKVAAKKKEKDSRPLSGLDI